MKAWTRIEDWTNLLVGAYLLLAPFLFGTAGDAASSGNAYVLGSAIVVVALWALAAPHPGRLSGRTSCSGRGCS